MDGTNYKQFTMSMFAKKEDLYKAKAEYYQSVAESMELALKEIAALPSELQDECCCIALSAIDRWG